MAFRHTATQQASDQINEIMASKGKRMTDQQQHDVDEKLGKLDSWLDDKPDWIQDKNITSNVRDGDAQ